MGFLRDNGLMAAVVILLTVVPLTVEGSCINRSIRLGNSTWSYIYGDYFYGGRVEVCYNNTFRPICAQNWTNSDAQVLCNNLGFSSYSKY